MRVFSGRRTIICDMFYSFQRAMDIDKFQVLGEKVELRMSNILSVDCFTNCKLVFLASTNKLTKNKSSIVFFIELKGEYGKIGITDLPNTKLKFVDDLFKVVDEELEYSSTDFLELKYHEDDCPLEKFPSLYEDEYY